MSLCCGRTCHVMQVVYDSKTAKLLHNLPSGLVLGGLGLLWGLHGWSATSATLRSLAGHAAWALMQWLLTLLLPAAMGALRVALLGGGLVATLVPGRRT